MSIADGSQTQLSYVVETAPGVIPATPVWQKWRYASETLDVDKQTDIPDEIIGTRDVTDIVDVGRSITGSVNTLMSYTTHDDLLAALFCSDWESDVLVNGRADKTLSFEKAFDFKGSKGYVRYRGCRVNTLDLSFATRQNVQANWGIMGIGSPTPTTAIIAGATYEEATTTPVLNAALNIGSIAMAGLTATPKLNAASIRINNNMYANDILGAYEPDSHGLGRFEVTGSITALFENLDLYNAIMAHSDLSLALTIGTAAGSRYNLKIGKLKGMSGGPQVQGNNRPVVITMPFQAKYSAADLGSMSITRDV